IDGSLIGRQLAVAYSIWQLVGAGVIKIRRRHCRGETKAALEGGNGIELPAAHHPIESRAGAGRELTARAEGQLIRAAQYKALRNVECGRAARGTAIIDVLVPGYSIGLARRAGDCIVNRLAKGVDGHYPGASLPGLLQLGLKTVVVGGAE